MYIRQRESVRDLVPREARAEGPSVARLINLSGRAGPSGAKPREFERKVYLRSTKENASLISFLGPVSFELVCLCTAMQDFSRYPNGPPAWVLQGHVSAGKLVRTYDDIWPRFRARAIFLVSFSYKSRPLVFAPLPEFAYIGKVLHSVYGITLQLQCSSIFTGWKYLYRIFSLSSRNLFCERLHWGNYTFCGRGKIIFRGK